MRYVDQIIVKCDKCLQQNITLAYVRPDDNITERLEAAGWKVACNKDICPECQGKINESD